MKDWKRTEKGKTYAMYQSPTYTIQTWINPFETSVMNIKTMKSVAHRTHNTAKEQRDFIIKFMKEN